MKNRFHTFNKLVDAIVLVGLKQYCNKSHYICKNKSHKLISPSTKFATTNSHTYLCSHLTSLFCHSCNGTIVCNLIMITQQELSWHFSEK